MASFGHIAVGMAAGRAYTPAGHRAWKAMAALSVVSLLPDLDAIGFPLGVPYEDPWGHRGATHSIVVGLAMGLLGGLVARRWGLAPLKTGLFTGVVGVSHGLLDTLTFGGGLGCALLWPFSQQRFWAPVRFIPIAPIGLDMFSLYGFLVILSEVVIFSPFWIYAIGNFTRTRARDPA